MPRDDAPRAFLDVGQSLTGRSWVGPGAEVDRLSEAISQRTGLRGPVAQVLARAGIAPEDAEGYLSPSIRDLLPDPMSLRDMGKAADRLIAAMDSGQRIAIFGDYDVDGACSSALLLTWLRDMGHAATLYIPDRIDEGYGPNDAAMASLARDHDLIVTVDCGTLSHGPIAAAKGADVIVLDHHLGAETLPDAVAVVNPNRQDEDGSLSHLCAAAVVFLVLVEVARRLRASGTRGPDLMSALDLVALATVADVAPLVGVNRALVRRGLDVMRARTRPGLTALCDVARLDVPPSAYHLGYVLGPRINAGGRVGRADLGARLLSTTDPAEAQSIAERLDQFNTERREVEAQVRDAALIQAEDRGSDGPLVWAAGQGWHPGVVGIVASRLKEATGLPAVVIGLKEDGTGQGSGRSVGGVDLGASVHRLAAEGLLLKGGGHRMAAGLTVRADRLEAAMERLGALLARQGAGGGGPRDLALDGVLMPGAATRALAQAIEAAGPFGQGASAPRFAFPDLRVAHARTVGDGHLKLALTDGGPTRLDAIAFGAGASGLADAVARAAGAPLHVAGRVEINRFQGRETVQLRVDDVAQPVREP